MNDKRLDVSTRHGIGFCEALTLTFIVLKLTNVITWSWLVVLSPLIVEVVIAILVGIIMFVIDKRKETNSAIFN